MPMCRTCGTWTGDDDERVLCDDCRKSAQQDPGLRPETIVLRYHRQTPSRPEGAVMHLRDCRNLLLRICTCGLLYDLLELSDDQDCVDHLYPPFWDEVRIMDDVITRIRPLIPGV